MQIDRRFHPRVDMEFNVTVKIEKSDETRQVKATNLSLSGIQLAVDKNDVDFIIENCGHPAEFIVCMHKDPDHIEANVRLVVNRRLSQQKFLLGLKFLIIDDEIKTQLKRVFNLPNK